MYILKEPVLFYMTDCRNYEKVYTSTMEFIFFDDEIQANLKDEL